MRKLELLLVTLLVMVSVVPADAARCRVVLTLQNTDRTVPGPVNVECGTGSEHMHTAPFGNWGVQTVHSAYYDGHQWNGWKWDDGWWQWNSCTTYYDSADDLPQVPQVTTTGVNTHGMVRFDRSEGVSCYDLYHDTTLTFVNEFMQLLELDSGWDLLLGGNGSDVVTTLNFDTFSFPVTCNSNFCQGSSGWKSPTSTSGPAHSMFRVLITTGYW